ncbi:MAG: MFS transporter [Cyclobacteriaceae bacterium]|nr:MFS transporter [Cyclobacteriaceae bacterium]MCH8515758.1 MFS transporter [Cyclobacteriaceae bacterium]
MKNRQALALLFTANGVSGFAQGISMLSIPWYFAREGMSSDFNIAYATITFLTLFWGLYSGSLVDRFNRKRVFLATNGIECLVVGSVALFGFINGGLEPALILIVFAVTIMGYHMHYPNLYAFVQQITKAENYTRATSYIEVVGQTTNILAGAFGAMLLEGLQLSIPQGVPILGGMSLIIEPWTIYEIFAMDAITYLISVALIYFIRYTPVREIKVDKSPLLQRIINGLKFLRENTTILIFGLFSYSLFLVMLVQIHAVVPIYVSKHLAAGGDVFAGMKVLTAGGSLLAGIFIGSYFRNVDVPKIIIGLLLTASAAFWLIAFTQSVFLYLLLGAVVGMSNAGTRVFRLSYIFRQVPNEVVGRVNSVFTMTSTLFRVILLGFLGLPFFSQGSNITYAYMLFGGFLMVSAMVLTYYYPRLKLLDLKKK